MAKTDTITLGGADYVIHAFNIDELQEIGEILAAGVTPASSMKILKVALRRAEPKIENIGALETNLPEYSAASAKVMELAGIKMITADPLAAVPPTAAS